MFDDHPGDAPEYGARSQLPRREPQQAWDETKASLDVPHLDSPPSAVNLFLVPAGETPPRRLDLNRFRGRQAHADDDQEAAS
ncbi:hypothetical protein ACFYXH_41840 [Streptomyces sp. NPDC002730]|uniref:hypothetical protein n=1 Tax=Streptomyces sp. NPDC002730 TaxID=3364662 RepID=UPI0036765936